MLMVASVLPTFAQSDQAQTQGDYTIAVVTESGNGFSGSYELSEVSPYDQVLAFRFVSADSSSVYWVLVSEGQVWVQYAQDSYLGREPIFWHTSEEDPGKALTSILVTGGDGFKIKAVMKLGHTSDVKLGGLAEELFQAHKKGRLKDLQPLEEQ